VSTFSSSCSFRFFEGETGNEVVFMGSEAVLPGSETVGFPGNCGVIPALVALVKTWMAGWACRLCLVRGIATAILIFLGVKGKGSCDE
jgi:hypothetical protein